MLSEAWVLFLELMLSAGIAIAVTTWTLSRSTVGRSDLKEVRDQCNGYTKRIENLLANSIHDYGETIHAMRRKIEEVEFWNRDNLALKTDLARVEEITRHLTQRAEIIPALEVKVETMWNFAMDRGRVEAKERGFMKRESPLTLTAEGRKIIQPLMPDLIKFCNAHPEFQRAPMSDVELVIADHFRQRILEEICEPNGIYLGACVVMIMEGLRLDNVLPQETIQ